jgi:predicted metal-binding protein
VENLAHIPFEPMLTEGNIVPAEEYLPICAQAELLIVPDISGYVGADMIGCILASGIRQSRETVLLVDIGTNGEMALCHNGRLVACATAAGPALEGAQIRFGMRGSTGAIDHVTKDGCSVIGGGEAKGICGSGLVDAVAVLLEKGLLTRRGKLLAEVGTYPLADGVYLTQEDIRQVQLAKGAIAAGIECMAAHLGIRVEEIDHCILAGAFGSFLNPDSACRMGLLPETLQGKITAMGNLAGAGSQMLAMDPGLLAEAEKLARETEYLELAKLPDFQREFAQNMGFREEKWLVTARKSGFQETAYLNVDTLKPMEMVRKACAADQCRAYGKNWTCPPYCGTLEECADKISGYRQGILLQTVGKLEKTIDTRGYRRAEQRHLEQFHSLCRQLRKEYPHALCLGSGGCRICGKCAWPEPCRFPEKACSSMEGYGLFVTQVCRDNGAQYHHGERTVTYTACILF